MVPDLANLRIVEYPDPVLRRRAAPVPLGAGGATPAELPDLARRMVELMHQAEGIGLAAPQVGVSWRLFVVEIPPTPERSPETTPATATAGPVVYVNPVITPVSADVAPMEEGCLSLPEIRGEVIRPLTVRIDALDAQGRPFSQLGTGLLARCWQHEQDHLDGVLIIDRMTQMSRLKNRAALRDLERG